MRTWKEYPNNCFSELVLGVTLVALLLTPWLGPRRRRRRGRGRVEVGS